MFVGELSQQADHCDVILVVMLFQTVIELIY